jgi:hypothetical protein
MEIRLGNLSVEDMGKRAGFEFPEDLKAYMEPRRQQNASNVAEGEWHCFEMPFMLVCGGVETASEIHNYLKEYSAAFEQPLQIVLASK